MKIQNKSDVYELNKSLIYDDLLYTIYNTWLINRRYWDSGHR
jgi:hypothetical protein